MRHKVTKQNEKFNVRTRIDLSEGREYVAIANNYRNGYSDGKGAYFLDIRSGNEAVYVALDEQDMIELFKGFVEIAQWYKDKGFEVGI